MLTLTLATLVLLEISVLIFTLGLFFYKRGYSVPESLCYGGILAMALLSALIQLFFLARIHQYSPFIDVCITTFCALYLFQGRKELNDFLKIFLDFFKNSPWYFYPVYLIGIYLFLQSVLLPPSNHDSMTYTLARVLLFQYEGSLFLTKYNLVQQATFPWGFDILAFLQLRFFSDFGSGYFNFISYLIIITGNYALIKKVLGDKTHALVGALLIASLTTFVTQSTTPKNDLPQAAIACACFLLGYDLLEKKNQGLALVLLLIFILFGTTVKSTFPGFALPLLALLFIQLIRNKNLTEALGRGLKLTIEKPRSNLFSGLLALVLFALLAIYLLHNLINFGHIFGEPVNVAYHKNQDGPAGAVINILRYFIQIFAWPDLLGGNFFNEIFTTLSGEYSDLGKRDAYPTILTQRLPIPQEDTVWYGWTGVLVFIAMVVSLFRGQAYTRLIALVGLFYFLLFSAQVAWSDYNSRLFAIFFASGGVCAVETYRGILRRNSGRKLIYGLAVLSLCYATFLNSSKPLLNVYEIGYKILKARGRVNPDSFKFKQAGHTYPGPLLFTWTHYVFERDKYHYLYYYRDVPREVFKKIKPDSRVLLISIPDVFVFPFLFNHKGLKFDTTTVAGLTPEISGRLSNDYYDYILYAATKEIKPLTTNGLKKAQEIYRAENQIGGQSVVILHELTRRLK